MSYEFVPLMNDYKVIFNLHEDGGASLNNAMIRFIDTYNIRFENHSEIISSLRLNPDNQIASAQMFEALTSFYEKILILPL